MQQAASPLRFGVFELDVEAGELRKDGVLVRLPPQPFKLLLLLACRPGRVVTREDIRSELWPDGTNVDFDQGVNFSIKQVREALGDDAEHPRYIQTIPRRGYRFVAPVETGVERRPPTRTGITDINLQKALWENIAEIRVAQERRRRVLRWAGAATLVLLALLLGLILWR